MGNLLNNDWFRSVLPYFLLFVLYLVVTSLTDAFFMGDTRIYAREISRATTIGEVFWDPGHPFWRPLGWLLSGVDHRSNPTLTLLGINWVIGLISTCLVYALSKRFSQPAWVPYFVSVTFLFANPILNYIQSGQPYVTGVMFLLIAFYSLVREVDGKHSAATPFLAGLCLALAVCIWIPYVFSLPAIGLFPLIYAGVNRSRVRLVLITSLVCAVIGISVYASMALHLGIHSFGELKTWIASAGHGDLPDTPIKAVQRMLFTLARSVINMGEDGRLFKRFTVHDPFSPVSVFDLVRLSLWKLAFFYLFILAILYNLVFSKIGRKTLILLLITTIPFLAFAIFIFEGGSIERYLPLFPMVVMALAVSMGQKETRPWTRIVAFVFVGVAIISNVGATSTFVLGKRQDRVAERIKPLQPLLKSPNRVVTVNEQDELYAFNQNSLFNPINLAGQEIDNLVTPHSVQILRWRQIFAEKTLAMWQNGGDVWVTKRVLSQRPRPEWNWVEGDDPTITWADINRYFAEMEIGQQSPGEDGFVMVASSEKNKQWLESVVQKKETVPEANSRGR